jgi:hypothetical protein
MGTGIEIDRLFLKLDHWPGTMAEIFTILTLFSAKNLVLRKKTATVPGSDFEIKKS